MITWNMLNCTPKVAGVPNNDDISRIKLTIILSITVNNQSWLTSSRCVSVVSLDCKYSTSCLAWFVSVLEVRSSVVSWANCDRSSDSVTSIVWRSCRSRRSSSSSLEGTERKVGWGKTTQSQLISTVRPASAFQAFHYSNATNLCDTNCSSKAASC